MARVLEPLSPLVSLLLQASAPVDTAAAATDIAAAGGTGLEVTTLITNAVIDRRLVSYTLVHAGVLDKAGKLTEAAPLLLAQAHAMVAMSVEEGWELVLTVPAFLKDSLGTMSRNNGGPGLPLDTGRTIREVAESAQTRLVIAAPYLHPSFVVALAPALTTLLEAGGTATVITRALGWSAPNRSDANVEAVSVLREAAGSLSARLKVCSWDENGLGVHFKVVLADDQLAYIGSANLTPGGTGAHAEAGVLLRGTRVRSLSHWLQAVADELTRRSVA
ncbi:phospholipase D-like domain-containing protein [Streptomyces tendae]|uniref:phospholipase D-like domain-containing protein n=1 Tax=Streptomyces tendae TaxID=1932 RepID=UPI00132FE077|nr:phospholipase D-like domain-containing protein [Streptomyces tendae]